MNYGGGPDYINWNTFGQILEMDDDMDECEFSAPMVKSFLEQAESTFDEMETAIQKDDLGRLAALGHYLKGSAATLGLSKIEHYCELIQAYGSKRTADGQDEEPDEQLCMSNIRQIMPKLRSDYKITVHWLKAFYEDKI